MKKSLLIAAALLTAAIMPATAQTQSSWCETATGHLGGSIETTDASSHIYLTVQAHPSETNALQVIVKPYEDNTVGISFIQINGGNTVVTVGDGTAASTEKLTEEQMTLTVPFNEGVTSGQVEVLYAYPGWNGRWMVQIQNFDFTSTCGDCDLTEAPTMTSAEVVEGSATMSGIQLNVAGTTTPSTGEAEAITKFRVKIGNGTTDYTAENGVITLSGLSASTDYTAQVYAVDRCNNQSEGYKEVSFTTTAPETSCGGDRGHFGTPENLKVSYTIVYDDQSSATVTLKPYDSGRTLDVANIAITGVAGEQLMTIAEDGSEATYTFEVVKDQIYGIYFLYSLDNMDGNEMTAENINDTENLIYYRGAYCSPTGIEETEAAEASLYPNPASQYVNITAADEIKLVRIIGTDGGLKLAAAPASESATIDIASLASGQYIVIIETASASYTETMLVK